MPVVNIQHIGKVNFPDEMPHEDIINAIESEIIPSYEAHLEKTGFLNATKGALKGGMGALNEGIAQPLESMGLHDLAEGRRKAAEEYKGEAEQAFEPTSEEEVAAAQSQGIVPGALKWAEKNVTEPVGGIIGRYGPPTVAGIAAGAAAPELGVAAGLGRAAGFIGSDITPEMGENIQAAREAGTEEPSLLTNVAGGLAEAAIGHYGLPMTGKLGGMVLRKAEELAPRVVAGELTKEAAVKELGGFGTNIAKEIGVNAASNVAAMTGIEGIRRATSGQEVLSPEALQRYEESAKQAAILAPLFGGVHGVMNVRGAREALPEGRVEEPTEVQPEATVEPPAKAPEERVEEATNRPNPAEHGEVSEAELAKFITDVQEGNFDPVNNPNDAYIHDVMKEQHPEVMDFLKLNKTKEEELSAPADKHAVEEEVQEPVKRETTTEASKSDELFNNLYTTMVEGTPSKDPIVKKSKKAFDEGLIKSPEDLKAYVINGYEVPKVEESPKPSVSTSPLTTEHTVESLQPHLTPEMKRLVESGKLTLHDTADTLPGEGHPENVQGLTTPQGEVHLVASKLTPETLPKVAMHEMGVHVGMRGMVGDKVWGDLTSQALTTKGAAFDRARQSVPENTPEHLKGEETLAYLVENAPKLPIVKRMVSAVKNWVRTTFGAKLSITESDIHHLAAKSLRRESQTANRAPREETAFSHADPLVNDLFDPANRTTKVDKDPTPWESISKFAKRYAPTRISVIDPTDTLGAKLKSEDTYSVADKKLRGDMLQRALTQIGQVIRAVEELGKPVFKGDGTVGVKSDDRLALSSIHNRAVEFGKKHGFDGPQFIDEVARVMWGKETIKEDANLHAYAKHLQTLADTHKQNAKTMSKQGGAKATDINAEFNKARQYEKKSKELLAVNRERIVTPAHIARIEALMKKYPESKQIVRDLRDLNRSLVDLAHISGLIDAHTAKKWNAKEYYIPMYKPEDLESFENERSSWGIGMGAKTLKNAADYRREGHEHKINVWDNVQRHVAIMVASAAQNESRKTAIHQLAKYGEASRAKDQSRASKDGNLAVYENGVKSWYIVKDLDALIAFQNFNHVAKPLMQIAGRVLRTGALVNPLYWIRQLVRDPLAANFVANVGGVITPAHALYHYAKIVTGMSKEFKTLREHGVVGPVDLRHNYNTMQQLIGKAVNTDKNVWGTIKNGLSRFHEASDSATRVAVFKNALVDAKKKGLTGQDAENYAVHRAREIINFGVRGTSQTIHDFSVSTPFFASTLNGLDTVYKAATQHNLSPKESKELKNRFISRAIMMGTMSAIYAMYMQGDKNYHKVDPAEAAGNWLIPGSPDENGDISYYKVPVPFEVGFLFKTLPELFVQYMSGNTTNREIMKSLWEGTKTSVLPPLPLMGQLVKPAIEVLTNYDIHNMRPIETAHDQTLNVEMRGQGDNAFYDWLSDDLKLKNINLSPKKLRHLWQGYFAQLGAISASLADSLITSATGETKTPLSSDSAFLRGIKTDPTKSKYLSQFYELSNNATEIVNTLNNYNSTGQEGKVAEMVNNPENIRALQMHELTADAQKDISEIRKAINTIKHQPDSPETRKQLHDLKMAENQIAESVMKTSEIIK